MPPDLIPPLFKEQTEDLRTDIRLIVGAGAVSVLPSNEDPERTPISESRVEASAAGEPTEDLEASVLTDGKRAERRALLGAPAQEPPTVIEPGGPVGASVPGTNVFSRTGQPEGVGGEGASGMAVSGAVHGARGIGRYLAVRTLSGLVASGVLIGNSVLALIRGEASDANVLATIGGFALGTLAVLAHNRIVQLESCTGLNEKRGSMEV